MTKEQIINQYISVYEGHAMEKEELEIMLNGFADDIVNNLEPSLPDNLDEAAEEWCKRNNKGIALCGDKKSHYLTEGVDAFKAGVEWMAEQMNLPRWNTDSDPNFKPGKYFCVANALISPQGWSIAFKDLEKLPGFKED